MRPRQGGGENRRPRAGGHDLHKCSPDSEFRHRLIRPADAEQGVSRGGCSPARPRAARAHRSAGENSAGRWETPISRGSWRRPLRDPAAPGRGGCSIASAKIEGRLVVEVGLLLRQALLTGLPAEANQPQGGPGGRRSGDRFQGRAKEEQDEGRARSAPVAPAQAQRRRSAVGSASSSAARGGGRIFRRLHHMETRRLRHAGDLAQLRDRHRRVRFHEQRGLAGLSSLPACSQTPSCATVIWPLSP